MLRTGTICVSFLYNYLTSELINSGKSNDDLKSKTLKLKVLSEVFSNAGGVLSKLSQLISTEHGEFDNSVFSECKPFKQEETQKYIENEIKINPEFINVILDLNIYKSGSVGQVYKGKYKDDDIVTKVQYFGLVEQFKTDIQILNKIIYYLYNTDPKIFMGDIEEKLYNELDYRNEAKNQEIVYKIFQAENIDIIIPKIIDNLSTDKLLTMQFLDAEVLSTFIKDSTQKQKNYIGKKIVEFIFILFYKHCIFYTDIHYGNFLVKDKDKLAVIDFGAISKFEPELLSNIKNLHKIMFTDDKIGFYQIVEDLGILTSKTSLESKEYMYSYFKMQFKPFTCDKMFNFSDEYIALTLEKNMDLLKQWELPPGMIHLNRIPYGLYNLLNKLNVTANVTKIVRKLLTEDI